MKKHKTRYIILTIILLLVIFVIFRACGRSATAGYTQETASVNDVVTYYSFTGNIASKNKQQLVANNTYQITKICVSEGDYVSKGQTLYTLDTTDLQSNLSSANASVQVAQNQYQQAQNDLNSAKAGVDQAQANLNAASQPNTQNVQSTLAQLNQAKANLQSVQQQIDSRTIKAAISGTVADIYTTANSPIKMGDSIMDVVDYDSLMIDVKIDEYDIANIKIGDSVDVYVNSLEKNIMGTVTKIANQATTVGDLSYFDTEISLNKEDDLRVGISAEVRIVKGQNLGAVTISMAAVQFDVDNKPYVLMGDIKSPTKKYVTIGENDGKIIAITDGLAEGDVVYVPRSSTSGNSNSSGLRTQVNNNNQ